MIKEILEHIVDTLSDSKDLSGFVVTSKPDIAYANVYETTGGNTIFAIYKETRASDGGDYPAHKMMSKCVSSFAVELYYRDLANFDNIFTIVSSIVSSLTDSIYDNKKLALQHVTQKDFAKGYWVYILSFNYYHNYYAGNDL